MAYEDLGVGGGYDSSVLAEIQRTHSQLNQTLAQFQLNFKEEAERFEFLLRGWGKDNEGKVIQISDPILNELGINHIMKKVKIWMTKILAQSDFEEEMIRGWCVVYGTELICDAAAFGDLWDLKQEEYSSFVHDLVLTLYSMMCSARNGGLRETIGKISKVVESFTSQPQQKRIGL